MDTGISRLRPRKIAAFAAMFAVAVGLIALIATKSSDVASDTHHLTVAGGVHGASSSEGAPVETIV